MGHVKNADGSLTINPTPSTVEDLQALANLAINGGLPPMTSAQRLALSASQVRVGWLVSETDTGEVYERVANGGWKAVTTVDSGFVELTTFGTGWAATGGYKPWVRRVGNRVEIGGAITRTTTLGALSGLVQIPEGFRITNPNYPAKFVGTAVTSTGQGVTLFYNTGASHYLQVNNTYLTNPPLGSGAVIPLSGSWFVD